MPKDKHDLTSPHLNYLRRVFYLLLAVGVLTGLGSCSGKRYIPKDKHLLTKNQLELSAKKTAFSKSDLSILYPQKPNSSLLGVRFGLWVHYVTQHKTDKKLWNWVHTKIGKEPV